MKTNSKKNWTHVLEADQKLPVEEQSVFHLKPLSRGTFRVIADAAGMTGEPRFAGSHGEMMLKECLFAWENVRDPDTCEHVAFPDKPAAAIELLPGVAVAELAVKIWERAMLADADRKN